MPATTLVETRGLCVDFPIPGKARVVRALDGIDLTIRRGETLALIGESGSGKSTLGRAILHLESLSQGNVFYNGTPIAGLSERAMRPYRRHMQMVFQDPFSSLNPRMRIGDALGEPLRVHGIARGAAARDRVARTLEDVGLPAETARRFPHEFSGGQRQRIAIARAIIADPRFIVADEPLSALDISVQAQIIDLFDRLKADRDLTYLFVSHDLPTVRQFADRVAVLYRGRLLELGPPAQVFANPAHPYTRRLLSAVPAPYPDPAFLTRSVTNDSGADTPFDVSAPLRALGQDHMAAV